MKFKQIHNHPIQLSEKSLKIQSMFDKISKRYDFLNRILSAGQDVQWRNKMISLLPENHAKNGIIYDIACGTGDVLFSTKAKRKDYNQLVGFDISSGMLEQARIRTEAKNYSDIQFFQASAEKLPAESESADCITIAFGLRNVDNRDCALQEFNRVLKKGGTLFVLEFFQAENNFISKFFDFYFKKILPKIGGLFSDKSAYEYLPQSVSTMPSGHDFQNMLETAGFHQIEQIQWLSGATRLFKAVKK